MQVIASKLVCVYVSQGPVYILHVAEKMDVVTTVTVVYMMLHLTADRSDIHNCLVYILYCKRICIFFRLGFWATCWRHRRIFSILGSDPG
jgi:hypothetical protein